MHDTSRAGDVEDDIPVEALASAEDRRRGAMASGKRPQARDQISWHKSKGHLASGRVRERDTLDAFVGDGNKAKTARHKGKGKHGETRRATDKTKGRGKQSEGEGSPSDGSGAKS